MHSAVVNSIYSWLLCLGHLQDKAAGAATAGAPVVVVVVVDAALSTAIDAVVTADTSN